MTPPMRCPTCLSVVRESDLEWRCPPQCLSPCSPRPYLTEGDPHPVRTRTEQSYSCPIPRCRIVHTWPFVRGCDRRFPLVRPDRAGVDRHVAILALDQKPETVPAAMSALVRSWSRAESNTGTVVPLTIASRRLWRFPHTLGTAKVSLGWDEPLGFENTVSLARLFLHVPMFDAESLTDRTFAAGDCARLQRGLDDMLRLTDTICLPLCSDSAIEPESRTSVEARIKAAGRLLAGTAVEPAAGPGLLLLVTDEQRLAARVGAAALPGSRTGGDEIIDGYILDGLRLREMLVRHFAKEWIEGRIRTAFCRSLPDDEDDLSGMRAWLTGGH